MRLRSSHEGFGLLEVLLVVGIVSIIGTLAVPLLQQNLYRSDLNIAKSQVLQGLQIAREFAMAGKEDTSWSFFIPAGVIFPGTDYTAAMADPTKVAKSITLTMPDTVRYTGIDRVTYGRNGKPNIEGTVTLTALNNEQQNIQVIIAINPGTVTVTNPPSSSSAASSASSIAPTCPSYFTLNPNNVISINAPTNVTFTNIGALRQSGGSYVDTLYCYSTDNGSTYNKMLGAGGCPANATVGNAANPSGGETRTVAMTAGQNLVVQVNNYLKFHGSLVINDTYNSKDHAARFWYMPDGVSPGPDATHTASTALRSLLQSKSLLDGSNLVNVGACELVLATEMEVLNISTSDYIDAVIKLSFN